MEKIILNFLMSLMMAFCTISSTAHDFEVDGIFYNRIGSDHAIVTYKSPDYTTSVYMGDVAIPEAVTYGGITYSVTAIGSTAFYGCTGLTSVTIPNSVTSIDGFAFSGCTGLTSVTIPNSVTSIGNSAFKGCTGLTSMTIPNSVTSIGESTFSGCTGLTSMTIPNSVTSIGNSAFIGCTGLTSVSIPSSITAIGSSTFNNCRKLESITIPYPITYIGEKAFYYCEELNDVTCLAVTPPSMGDYTTIYPAYYMATLHVPEKSVEAYRASDWWSHFINIVGDASGDNTTPADAPINKCDTNDDGEVNIADVNRVIDAILSH